MLRLGLLEKGTKKTGPVNGDNEALYIPSAFIGMLLRAARFTRYAPPALARLFLGGAPEGASGSGFSFRRSAFQRRKPSTSLHRGAAAGR